MKARIYCEAILQHCTEFSETADPAELEHLKQCYQCRVVVRDCPHNVRQDKFIRGYGKNDFFVKSCGICGKEFGDEFAKAHHEPVSELERQDEIDGE